jgi:Protein of unknown function (DUF1097)
MKSSIARNAIVAVILAIVAFLWIWLYPWLGAKAYWVALVTFGVCMAYGSNLYASLPWMTIGTILGPVLGLLTFYVYMQVLPLYYGLSVAIIGAIVILFMGLVSIPKMREILPMFLVGWGCYLGAIAQYDYLFAEKAVEAIPRAVTTLFGVIISLAFGMLVATLMSLIAFSPEKEPVQVPATPQVPEQ